MAYTHTLEDLEEDEPTELIFGLQASATPQKLAFWLNKALDTRFIRCHDDFQDADSQLFFPVFYWENQDEIWILISNKHVKLKESTGFFQKTEQLSFLIKEFQKFDYFLAIYNHNTLTDYVSSLKNVKLIQSSYVIDENQMQEKSVTKLKIKTKLIFKLCQQKKQK